MKRCALLVVAAIVVFGTNDSIVLPSPQTNQHASTAACQPPLKCQPFDREQFASACVLRRRSFGERLEGIVASRSAIATQTCSMISVKFPDFRKTQRDRALQSR